MSSGLAELRRGSVAANGLTFGYVDAGEGPLVLCLHGFPDHALSFLPQIDALARRGFRVVAPFMRGYAPTDIPVDGPYQSAALARDVVGLIDALGGGRAHLIGHDWGAIAAYGAAVAAPEKVDSLVTLAIPYGPGLGRALVGDSAQQLRSWYMFFFLSPFAEAALTRDDFAMVDRIWAAWSPGWRRDASAIEALKATFRAPGVAKASIDYYRHAFLPHLRRRELDALQGRLNVDPVRVRTLYLHGAQDGCIDAGVASEQDTLFPEGLEHHLLQDCGHFLHLERPQTVNALIEQFFEAAR